MRTILLILFTLFSFNVHALALKKDVVNGIELAYYDSQGDGETIVFIHGNSSSSAAFFKQLTSDLGKDYRIIAVDLPGHGQSARSSNPSIEYLLPNIASTLTRFIEQNDFDTGAVFGWSLGGHILLQMADDLEDVKGFGIFGTPPIGSPDDLATAFLPVPELNYGYVEVLTPEQMDDFVDLLFTNISPSPFSFRHDIRATDGRVRTGIGYSIANGHYISEKVVVSNLKRPLAIFHGANEEFVNFDYFSSLNMPTLWKGQVHIIYAAGHTPQVENHYEFNTLIRRFMEDISSANF